MKTKEGKGGKEPKRVEGKRGKKVWGSLDVFRCEVLNDNVVSL